MDQTQRYLHRSLMIQDTRLLLSAFALEVRVRFSAVESLLGPFTVKLYFASACQLHWNTGSS